MPGNQVEEIQDPGLRALMADASAALDDGRNYECVRACADAYLMLLRTDQDVMERLRRTLETPALKAGLERGTVRFAPFMFPRLAAKLHLEGPEPEIVFDRQTLGFAEAIQYFEFTLNLIVSAQHGALDSTVRGGGGLG